MPLPKSLKFWKSQTETNNTVEAEAEISSSSDSDSSVVSLDREPTTGVEKWLTFRNIALVISVFDLTVSLICGSYFFGSFATEEYEEVNASKAMIVQHERYVELYYTGATFCSLFVVTSILLLVAAIRISVVLLWIWLLTATLLFILLCLSYEIRIAQWNLFMIAWQMSIILILAGIYKFVQNFIMYRWTKELQLRPRRQREGASEAASPVRPATANTAATASHSSSDDVDIMTHAPGNPAYNRYMVGRIPSEVQGGLFDFGRKPRHRRNRYGEDDVDLDEDSEL